MTSAAAVLTCRSAGESYKAIGTRDSPDVARPLFTYRHTWSNSAWSDGTSQHSTTALPATR
jgi:hypothetical protein